MNPLSPMTYYRRHKAGAFLMMAIVCLATAGLFIMVALLDSVPTRGHTSYLTMVSRVHAAGDAPLEAGTGALIQAQSGVARVIPDNGLHLAPPALIGLDSLRLMGVSREDAQYLMSHFRVRLKEGRMFEPRSNEIVLSEEIVRALDLRIGDPIDRTVSDVYYAAVPSPLVLVGILEGDPAVNSGPSVRVGFASHEYLADHELFAPRALSLLVVAEEGRTDAVDQFLQSTIRSTVTEVETYADISRLVTMARQGLILIFGIVNSVVAIVVALVVGLINRMALTQRIEELGVLHALGLQRHRLISRLTLETALVVAIGCGLGLGLALVILSGVRAGPYYNAGMELNLANSVPFWFILPVPVVVISFATLSARRIFARLDSVDIIERGKLSMEAPRRRGEVGTSSARPLSALTFYRRHRRRAALLVVSMTLMILGVAFPVFLVSVVFDATKPGYQHLSNAIVVSPGIGTLVDPGVTAQIRNQRDVDRLIPALSLSVSLVAPPGSSTPVTIFGVSQTDLPLLMDRHGLQLVEGRLPGPRTNELVLSRALALNRDLRLGDSIGRPVGKDGDDLLTEDDVPSEMVIVGLLSREDLWLGFASLEYLDSHELTASRPLDLLVLPAEGRQAQVEAWLEQNVASAQTEVTTYRSAHGKAQQTAVAVVAMITAVEGIIVLIAVLALSALNHIFFAQRRGEFGILHATGRSHSWLMLRTVKETGSTVGIAWMLGAVLCVAGLLIAQNVVYAPLGLRLNMANPTPWLYTLPIPISILAVTAGTMAWTLSKLDPVTIIERRHDA